MKLKRILKSALSLYRYPSLFIHELAHVIAAYLVGGRVRTIEIEACDYLELYVCITLREHFSTKLKSFFFSFAPVFMLVAIGLLSFVSPVFFIIFLYMLTCLKKGFSLPSEGDFEEYKNYEKNKAEWEKMMSDPKSYGLYISECD